MPVPKMPMPKMPMPRIRPGAAVAGLVFAAVTGVAAAEAFKLPVDTTAPGTLVPTRHGRTHVSRRTGDGPTVVFESGLAMPLTGWSWVAQHLSEDRPFLAYDRPGTGWSHSAPAGWRRDYPAGLFEVLGMTNVKPPVILVGHSVGGLLIRMFAERYPELVGGLVFIDPSPPEQYERSEAAREGLAQFRDRLDRLRLRGALRLPLPPEWTDPMRRIPLQLVGPSVRAMSRRSALRAARHEADLSETLWAEGAGRLTTTPHPVAVVSSGALLEADPGYSRLAAEVGELSEISRLEVVEDADHMSLLCDRWHAARVADAIQWVVDKSARPPARNPFAEFASTEAAS